MDFLKRSDRNEVCVYCKNLIRYHDKKTTLTTSQNGNIIEEVHFHFNCWKAFFKSKIKEASKDNEIPNFANVLTNPMIMQTISNIASSDFLKNILKKEEKEGDRRETGRSAGKEKGFDSLF